MLRIETIAGRVGNFELKEVGQNKVLKFGVAIDSSYKDGNEWVNETEWRNCEVWGQRAENINAKMEKGDIVIVSGEIRTSKKGDKTYYSLAVNSFKKVPKAKQEETQKKETKEDSDELPF